MKEPSFFSNLIEFTIKQALLGGACLQRDDVEWIVQGLKKLRDFSDASEDSYKCLTMCFESVFDSASEIQLINAYEVATLGLETFSLLKYESLEPAKSFSKLSGADYCEFNVYMLKKNIQHCRMGKSEFMIVVDGITPPGLKNIEDKDKGTISSLRDFKVIGRKLQDDLSDLDKLDEDQSRYIEVASHSLLVGSNKSATYPRHWVKFPGRKFS